MMISILFIMMVGVFGFACYLAGYVVGYSWGKYETVRKLKGGVI